MKGKTGIVKWFDEKRGYGFIIGDEDHKEYFFHWTDIQSTEEFKTVSENQKVEFEIKEDSKRGDKAVKVKAV